MDWSLAQTNSDLLEFTRSVIALRTAHPVFRRRRFFEGRPVQGQGDRDIVWLTPTGVEMTEQDWDSRFGKSLTALLNGRAIREPDHRGEPVTDDSFLLCFNAHDEVIEFAVPEAGPGAHWAVALDTAVATGQSDTTVDGAAALKVGPRSLTVLRRVV